MASGSEIHTIVDPDDQSLSSIDDEDVEDITGLDMVHEIVPESDVEENSFETLSQNEDTPEEPSIEDIARVLAMLLKTQK